LIFNDIFVDFCGNASDINTFNRNYGGKKELEYENEIAFLPFHVFFIMVWFSSWFDLPKMQAKKKI